MYKVVPFMGKVKGSTGDVSAQLENIINQYESDGWEFVQLSQVTIEVKPGCIAGLIGRRGIEYTTYDQIIFKK